MSFLLSGIAWKIKIPAARKLVLLALADTASDEGYCWPAKKTIAEKCGMSQRAVDGHIQSMADDGLIDIVPRKREDGSQASNSYRLTIMRKPGGTPQNLRGEGAGFAGGDPAESAPHEPIRYEPVIEPVKNKKLTPPDGVSLQTWQDFNRLRKDRRAPITDTALNGIKREADKAGLSLQTALEICCERGWQGFRADWHKKDQPQTYTPPSSMKPAQEDYEPYARRLREYGIID